MRRTRGALGAGELAKGRSLGIPAVRHRVVAAVHQHLRVTRGGAEERVGVVVRHIVVEPAVETAAEIVVVVHVNVVETLDVGLGTRGTVREGSFLRGRERVRHQTGPPRRDGRRGIRGKSVVNLGSRVNLARGREVAEVARLVEGVAGLDAAAAAVAGGVGGRGHGPRAVRPRAVEGRVALVHPRRRRFHSLVRGAEDERERARGDGATGSLARAHARPAVGDASARRRGALRGCLQGLPRGVVGDGGVGLEADPACDGATGGDSRGLERALGRQDVAPSVDGRERFPEHDLEAARRDLARLVAELGVQHLAARHVLDIHRATRARRGARCDGR
mmetsp:Transcript_1449/g.6471  ORF Transcript_1449/g.6471 Transcript_1449/m.6471 type:complete len:334 (+) Transcript_1449:1049-2050(+)